MERKPFINNLLKTSSGFSLLEVLVAVTLFGIFVSVFYLSRSSNFGDSKRLKEDLLLHRLCDQKLNEILLNPPNFSEGLTLTKEVKDLGDEGYANYESSIEYQKLILPDFSTLLPDEEKNDDKNKEDQDKNMQKTVLSQIKDNVERMVWQVKVTVKNKENGRTYSLATWVRNNKAKIEIKL